MTIEETHLQTQVAWLEELYRVLSEDATVWLQTVLAVNEALGLPQESRTPEILQELIRRSLVYRPPAPDEATQWPI